MSDDSITPSLTEFPNAPVSWSPQDSETIAEAEGLDLTADHWAVIQALQEYFARNDGPVKSPRTTRCPAREIPPNWWPAKAVSDIAGWASRPGMPACWAPIPAGKRRPVFWKCLLKK